MTIWKLFDIFVSRSFMIKEKKCCRNCFYFREESKGEFKSYHCDLHDLHANEVRWPNSQFCGDEHWVTSKLRTRIENLEKLGI
jgi:hypothetical protein